MPRGKVTFRPGGRLRRRPAHLAYWTGDFARKQDADLAPELAEIVQAWRAAYSVNPTPGQDMRATLRALVNSPDEEISHAARVVDGWTDAQICGTAGRLWRQEHPDPETPVPADLFTPATWKPERIRTTARAALRSLPRKDGRRQQAGRDVAFAAELVRYWLATTGKRPTVTVESATARESDFLTWAGGMFLRAGRGISNGALAKILWRAIRERRTVKPRAL